MPELPEVETVVRDLQPELVGCRIVTLQVGRKKLRTPWRTAWSGLLAERTIHAVGRRGKWIILELDGGQYLVFHLGMTGQLTVTPSVAVRQDHTHLVFDLDNDQQLRFRDIRRFGSATLFACRTDLDTFFVRSGLGPEPFDLSADYWAKCLAATTRSLKAVLLDQRVVAGVGNIYADESLFEARLHPMRRGCDLSKKEADRLRRAIATVLCRAIERRGSSIRNYVGGSGLQGEYQNEFRVYGRTGEPCPRCRTAIARLRLAGRSTHYCPCCHRS